MMEISDELFLLFIFTIPGFFIVWTFIKTTGIQMKSDFEYIMFSTFWGVVLLAFLQVLLPRENHSLFLENIAAGMLVLVLAGVLFSWIISQIFIDNLRPQKKSIFYWIEFLVFGLLKKSKKIFKSKKVE